MIVLSLSEFFRLSQGDLLRILVWPQRSLLGSLLFMLCINDLLSVLNSICLVLYVFYIHPRLEYGGPGGDVGNMETVQRPPNVFVGLTGFSYERHLQATKVFPVESMEM